MDADKIKVTLEVCKKCPEYREEPSKYSIECCCGQYGSPTLVSNVTNKWFWSHDGYLIAQHFYPVRKWDNFKLRMNPQFKIPAKCAYSLEHTVSMTKK